MPDIILDVNYRIDCRITSDLNFVTSQRPQDRLLELSCGDGTGQILLYDG